MADKDIEGDDGDAEQAGPRPALALAVDAVLTDQRHGIGDGVHSDSQSPARNTHHGFEMLQFFLLLVEYRHATIVTALRRGG